MPCRDKEPIDCIHDAIEFKDFIIDRAYMLLEIDESDSKNFYVDSFIFGTNYAEVNFKKYGDGETFKSIDLLEWMLKADDAKFFGYCKGLREDKEELKKVIAEKREADMKASRKAKYLELKEEFEGEVL